MVGLPNPVAPQAPACEIHGVAGASPPPSIRTRPRRAVVLRDPRLASTIGRFAVMQSVVTPRGGDSSEPRVIPPLISISSRSSWHCGKRSSEAGGARIRSGLNGRFRGHLAARAAPVYRRIDGAMIKALVRAFRWRELLSCRGSREFRARLRIQPRSCRRRRTRRGTNSNNRRRHHRPSSHSSRRLPAPSASTPG
jgi:hypothetical protein